MTKDDRKSEICAFFIFILPFCENQLEKGGDRLDNPASDRERGTKQGSFQCLSFHVCLSKGEEPSPRDSQRAEGLCVCPIPEQPFRTGQPNGRLGRRSSSWDSSVVQTQAASIYRETAACEDSAVASSHSSEHGEEGTVRAQLEGGSQSAYHRRQNRGMQITKNGIQPKVHLVQQKVFSFFLLFCFVYYYYYSF